MTNRYPGAVQPDSLASPNSVELSVVMPCLNEAETVAVCIDKANGYLQRAGIEGEVVIADNGSADGSQEIAQAHGAKVVSITSKGYGNALLGGIASARGRYVIMGDADDSYDFTHLDGFVAGLRNGADLVMGNRFRGGIKPGAMPPLHRYLGNPVLSFVGRLFFPSPAKDFHCGLRGFNRDRILDLDLRTGGMEFASEMCVKASLAGYRVEEVPTTLSPDGRTRAPHLRSFRDGWRHLRFLMLYSPRWLFYYPGLVLLVLGFVLGTALLFTDLHVGTVGFDVGTMLYAYGFAFLGLQCVSFAVLTRTYAYTSGLLPPSLRLSRLHQVVTLERGLAAAAVLVLGGLAAAIVSLWVWSRSGFGPLDPTRQLRIIIPAVVGLIAGGQAAMTALFISMMGLQRRPKHLPLWAEL